MTANKATPELDRLAEETAERVERYILNDLITVPTPKDIIRSAIDQGIALAAADLIESQRNAVIEECAIACEEATLPEGYSWGRDAMEQFNFGKERAAIAIRLKNGP